MTYKEALLELLTARRVYGRGKGAAVPLTVDDLDYLIRLIEDDIKLAVESARES